MKVSVLINNHNYARFLPETLASVAAQTHPAHEIIVVDDGSRDDSLAVLESLRRTTLPDLRVHAQPNGGQLSALRAGARLAQGDWCAFLDADDAWTPDHLASIARLATQHPSVSASYCGHSETSGPPLYPCPWPEGLIGPCAALVAATRLRIGTITSTIALRRDLALKALALPAQDFDDDWRIRADDCLVYGASLHGAVLHHRREATVRYRIHGGNAYAHRERGLAEYQDKFRVARLCHHLAARVGLHDADLLDHLEREIDFPANRHPYVARRYRRALRQVRGSLWRRARLTLRTYSTPPK